MRQCVSHWFWGQSQLGMLFWLQPCTLFSWFFVARISSAKKQQLDFVSDAMFFCSSCRFWVHILFVSVYESVVFLSRPHFTRLVHWTRLARCSSPGNISVGMIVTAVPASFSWLQLRNNFSVWENRFSRYFLVCEAFVLPSRIAQLCMS